MKTFTLAAIIVLTIASVGAATFDPANAEVPAWAAIAGNPVLNYQPFRGYNGAQTYVGQDYSNLGNGSGNAVEAPTAHDGDAPVLHEAVEDLTEHLGLDCD
jgi:hypothetical protein